MKLQLKRILPVFIPLLALLLGVTLFLEKTNQGYALKSRFTEWRESLTRNKIGKFSTLEFSNCTKTDCTCVALFNGAGDDENTWKKILTDLKLRTQKPFRLTAFRIPGEVENPTARNTARELKMVLRDACSQWIMVGNSFGGWVAQWLAIDSPEIVSRLVLLSPAGFQEMKDSIMNELFTNPTLEGLKEFQRRAYFKPKPHPDEFWNEALTRFKEKISKLNQYPRKSEEKSTAKTESEFTYGKLTQIKAPTFLLWGEADRIISIEQGAKMHAEAPRFIFRPLKECGHLPQKECPFEVITAILQAANYGVI